MTSKVRQPWEIYFVACHRNEFAFLTDLVEVNTDSPVLSIQISQVCQLCQQSPRLFTNHAAQLHTLLVSIFNLNPFLTVVVCTTVCVPAITLSITLTHSIPLCLFLSQGLYCISVNCMDNAEAQFTTALRVSTWYFCCLSPDSVTRAATNDYFESRISYLLLKWIIDYSDYECQNYSMPLI